MLDKAKMYKDLWQLKREVEKQQSQIFAVVEKGGWKVVARGDHSIERIELNGVEDKNLKNVLNEALKEAEKKAEKKLAGMQTEMAKKMGIDL